MIMAAPAANAAQAPSSASATAHAPETPVDQTVEFSADQVIYESNTDTVTASGDVRMEREGNYLAADQVVWTRRDGQVRAKGNVVLLTPQGDKLVGDNVQLTDTLRDGTVRVFSPRG